MTNLLCIPERVEVLARLAHPAPLPGGCAPEERVVIGGIGWEGHLALDKELGDDRPGPRFYYLDGDLEIISTSEEHERIKEWIRGCMDIFFEEHEIQNVPRGHATMRMVPDSGAEPDKSWCLGEAKKFPDIVLEVALTSGGLPKLEIYRRFGCRRSGCGGGGAWRFMRCARMAPATSRPPRAGCSRRCRSKRSNARWRRKTGWRPGAPSAERCGDAGEAWDIGNCSVRCGSRNFSS
jgi:hypothetical protein